MNIDVLSSTYVNDPAIVAFGSALPHALRGEYVADMVDRICERLGAIGRIRRLRIIGHGGPGLVMVGGGNVRSWTPGFYTQREMLERCALHILGVWPREFTGRQTGRTWRDYPLLNDLSLRRLASKFSPGGWAELHGCHVAEGDAGKELLKQLAALWGVSVKAGTGEQFAGGGFENEVFVAAPDGRLQRRSSDHATQEENIHSGARGRTVRQFGPVLGTGRQLHL